MNESDQMIYKAYLLGYIAAKQHSASPYGGERIDEICAYAMGLADGQRENDPESARNLLERVSYQRKLTD